MAVRARYADIVIDRKGCVVPAASVAVYQAGTVVPIVEIIYADATGVTTLTNPFAADAFGRFAFYLVAPLRVDLLIVKAGRVSYTLSNVDVIRTSD